jgi:D-amino-acid dehydrogenase
VREEGAGVRVATAQGGIAAREMVMALGAWSPRLADAIGAPALKGAIQPGKGYSITYSTPSRVPRRPLVLRERQVCVTAWDSGFRLGSTMEFSGYDDTLNPRRLAALERGAAEYLHEPYGAQKQEQWFGWRPMSCDDVPIIGRVPGNERVIVATGHGMMGVSMSAATGQLVSDIIVGRRPDLDPSPYGIERFS